MNGEQARDMDEAWAEYLVEREDRREQGLGYGWNPRRVFEAGWQAAQVRSSGWYSGRE